MLRRSQAPVMGAKIGGVGEFWCCGRTGITEFIFAPPATSICSKVLVINIFILANGVFLAKLDNC